MTLFFEKEVYFDPFTDDAIIWGDEGSTRFRLDIRRSLLIDKYGLEKRFDHIGSKAIVQENRAIFERAAQVARDGGETEIILV